ncbi:MAG: hypothetical protein WBH85_10975 [Thermoanaerobaculia bacterium]
MSRGIVFGVAMAVLALAVPAQADIAVKFVGELTAGNLSPEISAAVTDFFSSNPQNQADFACYEGDLVHLETRNVVGVGVDCLRPSTLVDTTSGIPTPVITQPNFNTLPLVNTANVSVAIEAVTFFFFPGGHIVTTGFTTVRPFFVDVGDGDGTTVETTVTHMTGSFPGAGPTVIEASGRFSNLEDTARVRLSGTVDLSQFAPPGSTRIFFSCLFVIENGKGKGQGGPANN